MDGTFSNEYCEWSVLHRRGNEVFHFQQKQTQESFQTKTPGQANFFRFSNKKFCPIQNVLTPNLSCAFILAKKNRGALLFGRAQPADGVALILRTCSYMGVALLLRGVPHLVFAPPPASYSVALSTSVLPLCFSTPSRCLFLGDLGPNPTLPAGTGGAGPRPRRVDPAGVPMTEPPGGSISWTALTVFLKMT